MIRFDGKYFEKVAFTRDQIRRNLDNALRDQVIARDDKILEVKFNYTYTAFLKAGMALLSFYGYKVKSVPGHHVKIIEKMAELLDDEAVLDMGNFMRSKRNMDFYGGGITITEKEYKECAAFMQKIIDKIKNVIFGK